MTAVERLHEDLVRYGEEYPTERPTLNRFLELLSRAADPFSRACTDHVTASAIVARPDSSSFLLVYHRRLSRWLQPGGHVEPDDPTVLAAALRETREETGIADPALPLGDRILDLDVHPIPASRTRPAHVHYDVRYLATTTGEPQALAAEEIREARWFTLEDAGRSEADESLMRALRKAHARLGGGSEPAKPSL